MYNRREKIAHQLKSNVIGLEKKENSNMLKVNIIAKV